MKTQSQVLFYFLIILGISGCSDHNKIARDLDTYSDRLQSYTGITLADKEFSYHLNAPAKSDLKQEVAAISINLRDFHALNDCPLNQLIAERNTALGKMQLPSTRFAYESELIIELIRCTQNLQDNAEKSELVARLNSWTHDKQQQFPIVWANLITQSNEVYTYFTRATGFISGNASDNFQATKQALRFLLKSQTEHPVDLTELELHLQQLANSPLLARKWRTQLLLTQKLNHISPLLKEYLTTNHCQTLQDKQSIEIMQNIFRKLFAESIQPLAGELNKYHYQLTPLIEQLILSPYFTESFGVYLNRHNEVNYKAYKESMKTHIKLWQDIFTRCR